MIERDLDEAEPKHGVFYEKPYPSKGESSKTSNNGDAITPESTEVHNGVATESGGSDLFGLTENLDKAKRWGGYAMVAGAIAIAIYLSYRNYSEINDYVDKHNENKSEDSQKQGDTESNTEIQRNPEGQMVEPSDNGKAAESDQVYVTSEEV